MQRNKNKRKYYTIQYNAVPRHWNFNISSAWILQMMLSSTITDKNKPCTAGSSIHHPLGFPHEAKVSTLPQLLYRLIWCPVFPFSTHCLTLQYYCTCAVEACQWKRFWLVWLRESLYKCVDTIQHNTLPPLTLWKQDSGPPLDYLTITRLI